MDKRVWLRTALGAAALTVAMTSALAAEEGVATVRSGSNTSYTVLPVTSGYAALTRRTDVPVVFESFLIRITGDAVVSKGAQYFSGTEGMALNVGERVMSLAASTTVIQYKDGCR